MPELPLHSLDFAVLRFVAHCLVEYSVLAVQDLPFADHLVDAKKMKGLHQEQD